jgi:hypothetical protein
MTHKKYYVKFCVFLGREQNMKILHSYIELGLNNDILDEYHMFDFSRNINDHNFIFLEYNRLSNIYINKIFLHNYEENNIYLSKNTKTDWSPFYKTISSISKDNDIIIKCDDDILFIDIFQLKDAINDRYNDKESFLIHCNCINNGVCAYYQSELFPNVKEKLKIFPIGGILGILFEKPEVALALHIQFTNDLLSSFDNINNYIIKDQCINTRISINFILINGADVKYLNNVSYHDEYELSSLIPETLCRYNKIYGNCITSHLSYSYQDKILLKNNNIINNYSKIRDMYIKLNKNLLPLYNKIYDTTYDKTSLKYNVHLCNNIYKIKNWIKDNNYYIKNIETQKYLYIDYDEDILKLSNDKKTIFEVNNVSASANIINLGIYFFTRFNCIGEFRNENVLLKCYNDNNEKYIITEDIDEYNNFYIKFAKYGTYLSINDDNIDISHQKKYKWNFESILNNQEYIYMTRFIKNNKFYYKNIENNEIYTNYYMGWGLENVLS